MQTQNGFPYDLKLTLPSLKYLNEFFNNSKCCIDLVQNKIFPNLKEITESYGMYNAVRKHFRDKYKLNDESVTIIVVGDGSTPRTAATFAFKSNFKCFSIDPNLKYINNKVNKDFTENPKYIKRLWIYKNKIQDLNFEVDKAIIIHCHSHVLVEESLKHIQAKERHLVAMSCCVPQFHKEHKPDIEYRDMGILSPHNKIKIWFNI